MNNITHDINIERLEESILGIKKFLNDDSMIPVVSVLTAIKEDPGNRTLLVELKEILDSMGTSQGAVLTYAPYVCILLSNNLFDD